MGMSRQEYKNALYREWRHVPFWRDLVAEFLATFILMTVQCALPLSWGLPGSTLVQTALGMCFVMATTSWALLEFGGAHMNPSVTFAMALLARITVLRGLLYVVVQCCGGMAGAAFVYAITPTNRTETLAATQLHPDMLPWQGVCVEVWLTAILIITILGATNAKRKSSLHMPNIVVGMAVGMAVICGFSSTGASMNPARTLGPAVVMGLWEHHWIYWVGPLLGSGLAVTIYAILLDLPDKPMKSSKKGIDKEVDQHMSKL